MTAQLATAASEQNSDLFGKQHNKNKDHSQQDVTVFQHLFAKNSDSHIVLLSEKDSCHIGNHTDDSACKHLNDQQHIVTDSKYCHTFLTQLIHDNGIQSKCLYKISCHKDQHGNACNNGFFCYSKFTEFQPHQTEISFVRTDIDQENPHGKQETKYR